MRSWPPPRRKRPATASSVRPVPISIVVPARDAATTIEATLLSVLAQEASAWEVVVVDDGSVDDTASVVRAVTGGDHRARMLRQAAAGVSKARNLGLAVTRHDWVLFLDADDWIAPAMLSKLGAVAAVNPHLDVVRCGWAYETADGRTEIGTAADLDGGRLDLFAASAGGSPTCMHSAIVRKRALLHVGGFDPTLRVAEDWDLWQRLGRRGAAHALVPDVLAHYRLRPDSATSRDFARIAMDCVEVVKRGQTADPRVPDPLPQYVDGVCDAHAGTHVDGAVVWAAALAIGAQADPTAALDAVPAHTRGDVEQIEETIFLTAPFAAGSLVADWPALWPSLEDGITAGVGAIGRWCGNPAESQSVLRALERRIVLTTDVPPRRLIGATCVADWDAFTPVRDLCVPIEAQQLIVRVRNRGAVVGYTTVPVFDGRVDAHDLAGALVDDLGVAMARRAIRSPRLAWDVRPRLTALWPLWGATVRFAIDLPIGDPGRWRAAAREFARYALRRVVTETGLVRVHDSSGRVRPPSGLHGFPPANAAGRSPDRASHVWPDEAWDEIFTVEDPWGYTSPYEHRKYEHTLELLGDRRPACALELACAEGHLTVQLAPRVGDLLATDISTTALQRARRQCVNVDNVEFRQLDLRTDALPHGLDLVMCSEVLYYLDNESELAAAAERIADCLVVGGQLVMAHARVVVDEPDRTGFDWWVPFGATRIGEVFGESCRLELRAEIVTDLYRVQSFERVTEEHSANQSATSSYRSLPNELAPSVHRGALWGGFVRSRYDADREEVTIRPSILMYHRIAADGPDALAPYRVHPDEFERQIGFLRAHGYYGITVGEWAEAIRHRRALPGRPVVVTFDDGYRDFHEFACPVLVDMGFAATIFVVADFVGRTSSWDERYGQPADLMSWDQLRGAQRAGMEIGSHTATHQPLTSLPPVVALGLERSARGTFERELGRPVTSLAYPYGMYDTVTKRTMARAGYVCAVTTDEGSASLWGDPMTIPRREVCGDTDIDSFASMVDSAGRRNHARRAASRVRQLGTRRPVVRER